MKKIMILSVFAVAALTLWLALPRFRREKQAVVLPIPNIYKTAKPQLREFSEVCPFFGKVESEKKVKIVSLAAGRITSIDAVDGSFVKKGSLLFHLGGLLVDTRLAEGKEKFRRLGERIALAKSVLSLKKDAVAQKMVKRDELVAAKDALSRLEGEQAIVGQEIRFTKKSTHIAASMDGIFTGRLVCIGQEVAKGEIIAEIIATDCLRVSAVLFPPAKIGLEGKKARLDMAKGECSGVVVREFPKRTTVGAIAIWIKGDGFADCLHPGETVSGAITIVLHDKALAVSKSSIVRNEMEQPFVFVKTDAGYQSRSVKIGMSSHDWVELTSGITADDNVVVEGAYRLFYRDFNKIYQIED